MAGLRAAPPLIGEALQIYVRQHVEAADKRGADDDARQRHHHSDRGIDPKVALRVQQTEGRQHGEQRVGHDQTSHPGEQQQQAGSCAGDRRGGNEHSDLGRTLDSDAVQHSDTGRCARSVSG